jgi:hypothetical protein
LVDVGVDNDQVAELESEFQLASIVEESKMQVHRAVDHSTVGPFPTKSKVPIINE